MTRKLPTKSLPERLPGIVIVVLLHLAIGWALFHGLARKTVDQVIKEPLEVSLIEAPKPVVIEEPPPAPEPPPPEPQQPPPPKPKPRPKPLPKPAPKPAYVPPAEVPVVATTAPTISAVQSVERVAEPAPAAPPAPPAPVAPPAPPAQVAIGVACPNHVSVRSSVPYPSRAERRGLEGRVIVEFTVSTTGNVESPRIASSSDAVFNDVVLAAVQRLKCAGQNAPVRVRVPFEFTLN